MGSIVSLYGAGAGGQQDNVAMIQVPRIGVIQGLQWGGESDLDADAEFLSAQISFRDQFSATNDVSYVISHITQRRALTTSGVYHNEFNLYVALPDIPVAMAERMYMNLFATAGVVSNVMCLIHFSFDLTGLRR